VVVGKVLGADVVAGKGQGVVESILDQVQGVVESILDQVQGAGSMLVQGSGLRRTEEQGHMS